MAEVGRYRRRISLVSHLAGKNADGSWYTDPILIVSCWAFREKLRSDAAYVQSANSYENSYRYEIYYNSGVVIDTQMVLKDGSEEYKIVSIEVTGDKKVKWVLICNLKSGT
jgi:head-tail adaptor